MTAAKVAAPVLLPVLLAVALQLPMSLIPKMEKQESGGELGPAVCMMTLQKWPAAIVSAIHQGNG